MTSTLRLAFASAILALPVPVVAQTVCGDCDNDGNISVLDALDTAQIEVGINMPSTLQLQTCDVDGATGIGMIDALLIAQTAVGMTVSLTCPNNAPATINCAINDLGFGTIFIDYTLTDAESDPCDMALEWSTDMGATWTPGTIFPSGDPTMGLPSSPAGIAYSIVWDFLADLGPVCQIEAFCRVVPSDAFSTGTGCSVSEIVCALP